MTRSVTDAKKMLDVMAGPVVGEPYGVSIPRSSAAEDRSLRVALVSDSPHGNVDPEVADATRRAADALRLLGHQIEECEYFFTGFYDSFVTILEAYTAMAVEQQVGDAGLAQLEANTLALALRGRQKSAADYVSAVHTLQNRSAEVVSEIDGYDVILTPTTPTTAPTIDDDMDTETHEERWARYQHYVAPFTYPVNCMGLPAVSIPGGLSHAKLPIGIQIIGRLGDDAGVLAIARLLESAHPWRESYLHV
jgi:amidase/aspartyl-tRNA(Asn)/glutamyl-tRNA(Gln) amidotransferase subunit A